MGGAVVVADLEPATRADPENRSVAVLGEQVQSAPDVRLRHDPANGLLDCLLHVRPDGIEPPTRCL